MKKQISNVTRGIVFILLCTFPLYVSAQNITVRGKVSDSKGEPLIGVTVQVQSTTSGTVTDANGEFRFPDVPSNSILEVS